jgi:acetyl coenzyme A synthetase (ADP forming)-like protein
VQRFTPAAGRDRFRDTILRDGSSIRIRDAEEADVPGLVAFLEGLDPESRRLRFASVGGDLEKRARGWAVVEDRRDCSLVAETEIGGQTRIIGNGTYLYIEPGVAEAAFVVADEWQGMGVATLMLEALARRANEAGITTFLAEVLIENAKMLEVFRASGFPLRLRSEPGSIGVEFPTELTGEARQRFERREQVAAAAAVRALLHPSSVAVIGASRRRGTIGGELFHNLLGSGFTGPVYPVNEAADVVQSVAAFRSVDAIPGQVDLAIIVLPAAATVEAVHACAAKGVKSVVVVSPGFAETGAEGAARQAELVAACRGAGMRLVGPNAMGVINLEPDVRLNATFSPNLPSLGRVGFFSQSGALGLAIIEHANRLGLGLSSFISIGNKADLSGNDFLQYWEADDATSVIALYLESVGNPRKFSRIARRVGRTKPIIAVKSGRSAAGARASVSHTGARISGSDVTVDALFHQAGVVRTDTLSEFFDVASLLANQPLPPGRGVAILTNGGGPGILAADACEADGLTVVALPDDVRARLAEVLPPMATLDNPVDTMDAPPEAYREAVRTLAACEDVHAVIVLFVPPLGSSNEAVAAAVREATESLERRIPVLTVFMSADGGPASLRGETGRVPAFTFPEEAARALAHAAKYAEWRRAPEGEVPHFADIATDAAAGLLAKALTEVDEATRSRWLRADEVAALLRGYGIRVADFLLASTPAEAGAAADTLGGTVALKAVANGVVRKREAGAVDLGLEGSAEVAASAERMVRELGAAGHPMERFIVQRMVPAGVEMLVGVVHDRLFGPVIACGAGDSEMELLRDVAVRITPLTDRDADEMLRSLAMYPLLDGSRTSPRADVAALEAVLLRVSAMVEAHPEIVEMDMNPVVVLPDGAVVLDARIRIEAPERR